MNNTTNKRNLNIGGIEYATKFASKAKPFEIFMNKSVTPNALYYKDGSNDVYPIAEPTDLTALQAAILAQSESAGVSYDPTVSGLTATDIQAAVDELVASAPAPPVYKIYTALLTQTGTNNPIATVLDNTLSGAIVWTREIAGSYKGTLLGGFITGRTIVNGVTSWLGNTIEMFPITDGATTVGWLYWDATNDNEIGLRVYDPTYNIVEWSTLIGATPLVVDIKVYPLVV